MENLQNEYTLTTDELGMIQPIIETVENLQKEAQAVLRAITRLRRLEGQWNLMGTKLIRANSTPAAPSPQPPAPSLELAGAADRNGNE